jgi:hypothetical protein
MVYTEYFARNTAPSTYCDLHQGHGLFSAVASIFRDDHAKPAPPRIADIGVSTPMPPGVPPDAIGTAGNAEIPPAPESKKKRGFWARIFRRGGSSDTGKSDSVSAPTQRRPGAPPAPTATEDR